MNETTHTEPILSNEEIDHLMSLPLHMTYQGQLLTNVKSKEFYEASKEKVSAATNPAHCILRKILLDHRAIGESIPPGAPTPLRYYSQCYSKDFALIPYTATELLTEATNEEGEPIFTVYKSSKHGRSYVMLLSSVPTHLEIMANMDEEIKTTHHIYSLTDYWEYLIDQLECSPFSSLPDFWCSKRGKKIRESRDQERKAP